MESSVKHCSGGFVVRNGLFLLGRRSENKAWYANVWDIFGGHLEPGEDAASALVREFEEELGISPTGFHLFTVVNAPDERQGGMIRFHIYFITEWAGGDPVNCSDEHAEIRWFTRAELETVQLAHEGYLEIIDRWQQAGNASI